MNGPVATPDFLSAGHVPTSFSVNLEGIFKRGEKPGDKQMIASTPAIVAAICRDQTDQGWSAIIKFQTLDGTASSIIIPYSQIMGKNSNFLQLLAERGLLVMPAAENAFRQFVAASFAIEAIPRARLARQLGFQPRQDGRLIFVLPSQILTATPDQESPVVAEEETIFYPFFESRAYSAYTPQGSPEAWIEMATPILQNSAALFAVSFSLASPFLALAGLGSALIHLYGGSSSGKTTLAQLACSAWACGKDPEQSSGQITAIERWNSTVNAMEIPLATHSGVLGVFDELGSSVDAALSVYNVVGGRSKSRMTETGGMQRQSHWSLGILSTGELGMQQRQEEASNRQVKTGALIRALDIPIDRISDWGELSQPEIAPLVSNVKQRCGEVYGHVGQMFIQGMLDTYPTEAAMREALSSSIAEEHARLIDVARGQGLTLSSPHMRALKTFALVGTIGKGAVALNVLPVTEEDVDAAVESAMLAWLRDASLQDESERILNQLRDYLIRHAAQIVDGSNPESYPSQVIRAIRYDGYMLFTKSGLAEACEGTSVTAVAKLLAAKGMLHREGGKLTSRRQLSWLCEGRVEYYNIIESKLMSDGTEDAAADTEDYDSEEIIDSDGLNDL